MRESIANSFISTWVIIFFAILILMLVGSLSYSKSFKIKNRIISIIEKHETYSTNKNAEVNQEIDSFLGQIGYRTGKNKGTCPSIEGFNLINGNSTYKYCIYRKDTVRGYYYKVVAYMYFDIPFIGEYMEFPVHGETKIIYELDYDSLNY